MALTSQIQLGPSRTPSGKPLAITEAEHTLRRPVSELMVAVEVAILEEDMVNAMRVELTPLTRQAAELQKKRWLELLEQDREMGTEELEMGAVLDVMPMAVLAADSLGRWILFYAT